MVATPTNRGFRLFGPMYAFYTSGNVPHCTGFCLSSGAAKAALLNKSADNGRTFINFFIFFFPLFCEHINGFNKRF